MLKIGSSMALAMPPTITPMPTIGQDSEPWSIVRRPISLRIHAQAPKPRAMTPGTYSIQPVRMNSESHSSTLVGVGSASPRILKSGAKRGITDVMITPTASTATPAM